MRYQGVIRIHLALHSGIGELILQFFPNMQLLSLLSFLFRGQDKPIAEFPLDPRYNRTGHIWHVLIRGLDKEIEYGYKVGRRPVDNHHIHRFDASRVLIDPYAESPFQRRNMG